MAKYFNVEAGLRGAYCDGGNYVVMVTTRRALKDVIAYEANSYRDAGFIGGSKRAVSWLAATAWREAKKANPAFLPYVLPLARDKSSGYAFGVMVSTASRADYLEYCKNAE
jgi:hypothetical protein